MTDDLTKAAAEWSCAKIITDFAHCVDHRRFDELLPLLTDDYVVEWPGNSMGGQELVANMKQVPEGVIWRHALSPPRIKQSGADAIDTVSYVALYDTVQPDDGGLPVAAAPSSVAEYHDSFRLTSKGWRMSRRSVTVVTGTPY